MERHVSTSNFPIINSQTAQRRGDRDQQTKNMGGLCGSDVDVKLKAGDAIGVNNKTKPGQEEDTQRNIKYVHDSDQSGAINSGSGRSTPRSPSEQAGDRKISSGASGGGGGGRGGGVGGGAAAAAAAGDSLRGSDSFNSGSGIHSGSPRRRADSGANNRSSTSNLSSNVPTIAAQGSPLGDLLGDPQPPSSPAKSSISLSSTTRQHVSSAMLPRLPLVVREVKLLPKEMNRTQNWLRKHDPETVERDRNRQMFHSMDSGGSGRSFGERSGSALANPRMMSNNLHGHNNNNSSVSGNGAAAEHGSQASLEGLYEIQWIESENIAAARSAVADGWLHAAPDYL